MRRKLEKEIKELIGEEIDRLRCNLFSTDIKHKIYGGGPSQWPGLYSTPEHSIYDVLKAILDHCELELGHVTRTERVVVKKKEKVKPPVVYKKRTAGAKT